MNVEITIKMTWQHEGIKVSKEANKVKTQCTTILSYDLKFQLKSYYYLKQKGLTPLEPNWLEIEHYTKQALDKH